MSSPDQNQNLKSPSRLANWHGETFQLIFCTAEIRSNVRMNSHSTLIDNQRRSINWNNQNKASCDEVLADLTAKTRFLTSTIMLLNQNTALVGSKVLLLPYRSVFLLPLCSLPSRKPSSSLRLILCYFRISNFLSEEPNTLSDIMLGCQMRL